jgi:hypothetical protein
MRSLRRSSMLREESAQSIKKKKECKQRAAELHDKAPLFNDPPPKEDCPICFLPMPYCLICCVSLPPAAIFYLPIYDFVGDC